MLSIAMVITAGDIRFVASMCGVRLTDGEAAQIRGQIDDVQARSMLDGLTDMEDLDDQCAALFEDIELWLMSRGIVPPAPQIFGFYEEYN